MENFDILISEIKYEIFLENFNNVLLDEVFLFDKIKDLMNKDKFKKLSDKIKPQAEDLKKLKIDKLSNFKNTLIQFKIPQIKNKDAIKAISSKNKKFEKYFNFTKKLLKVSLPKTLILMPEFLTTATLIICTTSLINKNDENIIIKIKNMVNDLATKINKLDAKDKNFISYSIAFLIGYITILFAWGGLLFFLSTPAFYGLSIIILGIMLNFIHIVFHGKTIPGRLKEEK